MRERMAARLRKVANDLAGVALELRDAGIPLWLRVDLARKHASGVADLLDGTRR